MALGRFDIDAEVTQLSGSYDNGTWTVNATYDSYKFDKFGNRTGDYSTHTITARWQVTGRTALGMGSSDGQEIIILGRWQPQLPNPHQLRYRHYPVIS